MNSNGLIVIGSPRVEVSGGRARLLSEIRIGCDVRELWFEVDESYGKYLCVERADAFLVGLLYTAIHEGYDIECESSVSESLLYNLNHTLIPCVVKAKSDTYAPRIQAPTDRDALPNAGAVGTGASCGIDSMQAICGNLGDAYPTYKLTHLFIGNYGSFDSKKGQFEWQLAHAQKLAVEIGLELVVANSNLHVSFPRPNLYAVKYSLGAMIFALQKLWGTYIYASDGDDYRDCKLSEYDVEDCTWMDAIAAITFTTRDMTVVCDTIHDRREDKVEALADSDLAHRYLHVCENNSGPNCGKCPKCMRTLTQLYVAGCIRKFAPVFDVEGFLSNMRYNMRWLYRQHVSRSGDHMIRFAYRALSGKIPLTDRVPVWLHVKFWEMYHDLSRIGWLHDIIHSVRVKLSGDGDVGAQSC